MELKLFQKDVAFVLGVTEDSITNWEKNRSIPQINFTPNIINFLGYLPFEVDFTTFSGKLKAYRQIHGLSQKKLGKILKVDSSTVCSWEIGENLPQENILNTLDLMLSPNTTEAHSI